MSVIVATAYMDEAQGFDWLAMMDAVCSILQTGTPQQLLAQTMAIAWKKHQAFTAGKETGL